METEVPSGVAGQGGAARRIHIGSTQALAGGLVLIALALIALWGTQSLTVGTARAMGPGFFPRGLAMLVGVCGVLLALRGILRPGPALQRIPLRGPACVILAVLAFALTIREVGLLVAGPLAMVIGGFGTPEARLVELVPFAIVMTALCAGLFRYALGLPIPILVVPGLVQL